MAESGGTTSGATSGRAVAAGARETGTMSPATTGGGLESSRGATNIADPVVTKVAGIAAREVSGVYTLGGGASRAIGGITQRVGIGDERTQGVSVEVGERQAAVDLTVVVEYGESIPQVSQAIRDNVIKRIEGITGLAVTEVNVSVTDLHFPGDDQPEQADTGRVA